MRGSLLDVVSISWDPTGVITLLPPHTKKISSLNFSYNHWVDNLEFAELDCGPLLLLHTLRIVAIEDISLDSPKMMPALAPLLQQCHKHAGTLVTFKELTTLTPLHLPNLHLL